MYRSIKISYIYNMNEAIEKIEYISMAVQEMLAHARGIEPHALARYVINMMKILDGEVESIKAASLNCEEPMPDIF